MSHWRSGQFDKAKVPGAIHPFVPAHAVDHLTEINLSDLWAGGKRLILLDVDNTLVKWKSEEFDQPILDWVANAKHLGFQVCIISNTGNVERLTRITQRLQVETVRGRFKPSRAMFRLACIKFSQKPEAAIMVGDQLMTDILGANRAGIDAIWVKKMEGEEFGGTKINRMIERALTGAVYKALVVREDHGPADPENPTSADQPLVKQLSRFVVVGGSAFVWSFLLKKLFIQVIHVGGQPLGVVVGSWGIRQFPGLVGALPPIGAAMRIIGFPIDFCMIFYTYLFNRLWTFEAVGKSSAATQMRRFFLISLIGVVIQTSIAGRIADSLPTQLLLAQTVGTFFASIWNFMSQKMYAFKDQRR